MTKRLVQIIFFLVFPLYPIFAKDNPVTGPEGGIVPLWCSEKFQEIYGDRSELIIIKGENHMITRRRKEVVARVVSFFEALFADNLH